MNRGLSKRAFDVVCSGIGLTLLALPLLGIAFLVKLHDLGPIFYRQQRVGLNGRLFGIWKFRTMVVNADKLGLSITKDRDPRITPIGRILRKLKLDELPQLWNVFLGEMSFVGPRPEVPKYVDLYTPAQREILKLKPGITDLATLEFRNEEELLAGAEDVDRFYREYCLPRKIELNLLYAQRANLFQDFIIILKTVLPFLRSPGAHPPSTAAAGPGGI